MFTNTTNAFYVQDHLTLGPQVKLLLGGRYDIYRRNSHSDADCERRRRRKGRSRKREANAFTARVGLVYQPSQQVDLYGSFANSFKPLTLAQPDGSSLDPETGLAVRVRPAASPGTAIACSCNTAVYRILRQNVAFRRPGNVYVQAGEVESRGFEATSRRPSPRSGASTRRTASPTRSSSTTRSRSASTFAATRRPSRRATPSTSWTGYDWPNGLGVNVGVRYFGQDLRRQRQPVRRRRLRRLATSACATGAAAIEYQLNVNNVTDTKYFVPHQDYLQVYPGDPVNVLGTVRVRMK